MDAPCPRCHKAPSNGLIAHEPDCPAAPRDASSVDGRGRDEGSPAGQSSGPIESTAVLTSLPAAYAPPLAPPPANDSPARHAVAPRPGDLAPGARVGEYEITGLLGRGGMGTVYAGVHPVIGKRVAIKVLLAAAAIERGALERFQREAQAVNRIGHPAVVDVFAFGQLPTGVPYLIMELLDGQSLGERLRRGRLAFAEIRDLFAQLLSGLQAAHEVGVVHRDLKPDNLMLLNRPGAPLKILDFGIAKLQDDDAPQLTRSGVALGTPAYMSPEQALGRPIGPATDLYSAAVILYLCCAGRPPFTSDSSFEVQRKHVTEPPPPPSRFCEMPAELEALILRGLQKAPELRFPSARAMAEALAAVPAAELRPKDLGTGTEASALSPMPSYPGSASSGAVTLPDVTRRHRRKLQVVLCPIEVTPASARPLADLLDDNLATRLFELPEIEFVRPPAAPGGAGPTSTGPTGPITSRLRGEGAARAAGADLYLDITMQVGGAASGTTPGPARANLRIGDASASEAPFSARAASDAGDLLQLEDELFEVAARELRQRARSHMLRVRLVDEGTTSPARRALRLAEEAYSSPWSHPGVIEDALRAASDALVIDPGYAEAYYRRGTARLWLAATAGAPGDGQLEPAVADLQEACRRMPQLSAAPLFCAMALSISGRLHEALQVIDRAAALEVSRVGMRSSESIVYDVALAWPQLLASVLPSDDLPADQGLPLLTLARALVCLGREAEAEAALARLLPIEDQDLQVTRAGARRTMRTLPLYGPAAVLGALRLRQGRAVEACELLAAARARLASCEHVTAPVHLLQTLRLLARAKEQAGQLAGLREVEAAEAVLSRRLLGEDPAQQVERAARVLSVFWVPGAERPAALPASAPPARHFQAARAAVRAGDLALARQAAEAMRAAAPDQTTRKDAELLLQHIEAIAAL